jgi:MYXO-CTERM domain-containing protein
MSSRLGAAVLACLALTSTAAAERPLSVIVPGNAEMKELPPNGVIPYNTLYLNRCANGCTIGVGGSSSVQDRWPINSQRVLSSFPYGDAAWNSVVACVKDLFEPYKVNVVTQNPGSSNHFEIMIAGSPLDLDSSWTNYGGVAPGTTSDLCDSYLNNALVFAFAKAYGNNSTNVCGAACVNEICATAGQEIGHVWNRMDHVRLNSDPMTYYGYNGRRYFQDTAAQCGSDCTLQSGQYRAPNGGEVCDGTGSQSHSCKCGGETQNSHQTLMSLFGAGTPTPPVAKITSPTLGESVNQGFSVIAEVTDNSELITKVELKIDGMVVSMLDEAPYEFTAPGPLANGTHHVEIIAYDGHMTPGTAAVDVIIGPPCQSDSDCPYETDVCLAGRCVAGPNATGGLGTNCAGGSPCASQRCASDGTDSFCVELCEVGQCPDDFGCLDTGDGNGVCWPGYDDSGGCGCQTSRGGPAGMLLALLVMVLSCRRRRR